MAQITVNLIHDFREKHKVKEKVPFYGLRTGFLRAWFFTVVKVLFIFSLLSGMNLMGKFEENISLLDQYVRNDFTVPEPPFVVTPKRANALNNKTAMSKVIVVTGSLELRGPELIDGTVASANITNP